MTGEPVYQPTLSVRLQLVIARAPGLTTRELMLAVRMDPDNLRDLSRVEILLHNLRELGHAMRDRQPPDTLDDRWALTAAGTEYLMVVTPSGERPDVELLERVA